MELNKNTIKELTDDKISEFLSMWVSLDEELQEDVYSVERGEKSFEEVLIMFVERGLIIIPKLEIIEMR